MFRLLDKVYNGIGRMVSFAEHYFIRAGLADMMVTAESITQVN